MRTLVAQRAGTVVAAILTQILVLSFSTFVLCGCDSLRLAPSEQQKQNAWLHNRTAAVAAHGGAA